MVFKNKQDRETVIEKKEFTLNNRKITCNAYEPKDQAQNKKESPATETARHSNTNNSSKKMTCDKCCNNSSTIEEGNKNIANLGPVAPNFHQNH